MILPRVSKTKLVDRLTAASVSVLCGLQVIAILVGIFASVGCGGLQRDSLIKHPDSPMLIESAKGTVKVAIYDAETNSLIEYGWIDLDTLTGWTITKYDWQSYIVDQQED